MAELCLSYSTASSWGNVQLVFLVTVSVYVLFQEQKAKIFEGKLTTRGIFHEPNFGYFGDFSLFVEMATTTYIHSFTHVYYVGSCRIRKKESTIIMTDDTTTTSVGNDDPAKGMTQHSMLRRIVPSVPFPFYSPFYHSHQIPETGNQRLEASTIR